MAPEIVTEGSGWYEQIADRAELGVSYSGTGRTRSAAVAELGTRVATAEAAFGLRGVTVVHRHLTCTTSGGATGWSGAGRRENVLLRLSDLGAVEEVLAALVASEPAALNGPTWLLDDPAAARRTAQQRAVADARDRAEGYAAALGGTLGALLRLSEGPDHGVPRDVRMLAARAEAAPDVRELGLEPEPVRVNVRCTTAWALLDPQPPPGPPPGLSRAIPSGGAIAPDRAAAQEASGREPFGPSSTTSPSTTSPSTTSPSTTPRRRPPPSRTGGTRGRPGWRVRVGRDDLAVDHRAVAADPRRAQHRRAPLGRADHPPPHQRAGGRQQQEQPGDVGDQARDHQQQPADGHQQAVGQLDVRHPPVPRGLGHRLQRPQPLAPRQPEPDDRAGDQHQHRPPDPDPRGERDQRDDLDDQVQEHEGHTPTTRDMPSRAPDDHQVGVTRSGRAPDR